jgi:hypothetical protein
VQLAIFIASKNLRLTNHLYSWDESWTTIGKGSVKLNKCSSRTYFLVCILATVKGDGIFMKYFVTSAKHR